MLDYANADFDWDDANIGHIALHKVTPEDAEYIIRNYSIPLGSDVVDGEERFSELGSTRRGRILVVVLIERSGRLRVVTAFSAVKSLQHYWAREKGVYQ